MPPPRGWGKLERTVFYKDSASTELPAPQVSETFPALSEREEADMDGTKGRELKFSSLSSPKGGEGRGEEAKQ